MGMFISPGVSEIALQFTEGCQTRIRCELFYGKYNNGIVGSLTSPAGNKLEVLDARSGALIHSWQDKRGENEQGLVVKGGANIIIRNSNQIPFTYYREFDITTLNNSMECKDDNSGVGFAQDTVYLYDFRPSHNNEDAPLVFSRRERTFGRIIWENQVKRVRAFPYNELPPSFYEHFEPFETSPIVTFRLNNEEKTFYSRHKLKCFLVEQDRTHSTWPESQLSKYSVPEAVGRPAAIGVGAAHLYFLLAGGAKVLRYDEEEKQEKVFASEDHEGAKVHAMKVADMQNVLLRVFTGGKTELWHMAPAEGGGYEKKQVVYSAVRGSDDDVALFDSPFRHGFVVTQTRRLFVFGSNGKSQLGLNAEETAMAAEAVE